MKKINKKHYLFLAIVLIVAFFVRLSLIFLLPDYFPHEISGLESDALKYHQSAIGGLEKGEFSTYWPVGLPLILSLFYSLFGLSILLPLLFLILLSVGIVFIGYKLSICIYNNKKVALINAILLAIFPSFIWEAPRLLTDTLALFLFSLFLLFSFYALKDNGLNQIFLVLPFIYGFLILVRPNYIFIMPLFLIVFLKKYVKERIKLIIPLIVILLLCVAVITPWLFYTYNKLDHPALSTNGGINYFIGNNINSTGRYMDLEYDFGGASEYERNQMAFAQGIEFNKENPLTTLKLYGKKAFFSVFLPQKLSLSDSSFSKLKILVFAIIINLSFIFIEFLGVVGYFVSRKNIKKRRLFINFLLFSCLIFYLLGIIFFVSDRFVLPIIFVFTLFSSNIIYLGWCKLNKK